MQSSRSSWWLFVLLMGACNQRSAGDQTSASALRSEELNAAKLIIVDGSSTVLPIAQAVTEAFLKKEARQDVQVHASGTAGGFKRLCRGETAINDASRPITEAELAACRTAGVPFIELPVAFDGLSVVVHPSNSWAASMTVNELRRLWEPSAEGVVMRWNQVREGWPDTPIHLYGAGFDSGTYDYFTAAIVGAEHVSRKDFKSSEDDQELVRDVAMDPQALGFFGFAYYHSNHDKLKLVAIDDAKDRNGVGPVAPSVETVTKGRYQPLSRPLFVYVSKTALSRPEVNAFVEFWLQNGAPMARRAGYIALPSQGYELALHRFYNGVTGTLFHGGSQIGLSAKDVAAER